MIADLGTRRGTTLEGTSSSSQWINGLSWMNKEVEDFPMQTVRKLSYLKSKKKSHQTRNSVMSVLINKHIQHQSITKATFQKKLCFGTVCQTAFLIQIPFLQSD